ALRISHSRLRLRLRRGKPHWRVMGAWWSPRSSKPLSARFTGRGMFDSYPLRHKQSKNDIGNELLQHEKTKEKVLSGTRPVLLVDCDGGDAGTSMAIGRWLADRGDGIGIVEGHCWSAANDIFLGCARRIARPGVRFIVHEAQSYVMGGAQAFRRA